MMSLLWPTASMWAFGEIEQGVVVSEGIDCPACG